MESFIYYVLVGRGIIRVFFSRRNVLKLKNAVYTDLRGMGLGNGNNEWRRDVEGEKERYWGDVAVVSRSPRRAFGV